MSTWPHRSDSDERSTKGCVKREPGRASGLDAPVASSSHDRPGPGALGGHDR